MVGEPRRIFSHSKEDVGKDGIKKSQMEGDRNRRVETSKNLAPKSKDLRNKGATAVVPSKETASDPYGVVDCLVKRGHLSKERSGRKERINNAYKEANDLLGKAWEFLQKYIQDGRITGFKKEKLQANVNEAFNTLKATHQKYGNMGRISLISVEKQISAYEKVLEPIKNSGLVPELLAGVRMRGDGVYIIDPSKVKLADLAKLYLSGPDELIFEKSHETENPECSKSIPVKDGVENLRRIAVPFFEKTLQAGYELRKANGYSQEDAALYEEVLKVYSTLKLYATLGKTDLGENEFREWYRGGYRKVRALHERNRELSLIDISYANNIREASNSQDEQYDSATPIFLFSGNSIERASENEMVVSHVYRDLWAKHGLQQPSTDKFWTDYARVQSIVEMRIEDIKPEDREGFLANMREVNQHLKETAEALARAMPKGNKDSAKDNVKEGDLNPLQLSLRDAIQETRRGNQWREIEWPNIAKRFDLNDDWVDIKLKKEHIEESCTKHRENVHVRQIIDDGRDTIQVAYNCSPAKIVETYESLIRANASLKYICTQFDTGVPAKCKPEHIKGREVLVTPFHDNNCLIHSLMLVGKPEKKWEEIESEAARIRNILVKEELATKKEFLDLQSVGRRVIDELIEKGCFERGRGLVLYQLATVDHQSDSLLIQSNAQGIQEAGKMVVYSTEMTEMCPRTEENPAKPEYALFVAGQYHFQPMSEPRKG